VFPSARGAARRSGSGPALGERSGVVDAAAQALSPLDCVFEVKCLGFEFDVM